jgi:hypothetical protein
MFMQKLDALRHRATAVGTRRQVLPALGGVAFNALASSRTGVAAQDNDKQKANKARRKFKKLCNQQKALCRAEFAEEPGFPCCDSCFSDDFLACLVPLLGE